MSQKIGDLLIQMGLDLIRFKTDADKATRIARGTANQIQGIANDIKSAFAAIGIGLSVGVVVNEFKKIVDAADELGKLSQKTGVAVESLSALKFAGELSNVSMEQLGTGLKQLNKNIDEGDDGFNRLGISLKDSNGVAKTTEQIFLEVADRFAHMKDGAAKTALAIQLLGKAGADLIPLMNGGAAGIKAATDEAREFGVVIGGGASKAAETFNDNLTRLNSVFHGLVLSLTGPMIEKLGQFTSALLEGAKAGEGMIRSMVGLAGLSFFGDDAEEQLKGINEQLDKVQHQLNFIDEFGNPFGEGPLGQGRQSLLGIQESNLLMMKKMAESKLAREKSEAEMKLTNIDETSPDWVMGGSESFTPGAATDKSAIAKAAADRKKALADAAADMEKFKQDIYRFNADVDSAQEKSDSRRLELAFQTTDALNKDAEDAAEKQKRAFDTMFGPSQAGKLRVLQQELGTWNDMLVEGKITTAEWEAGFGAWEERTNEALERTEKGVEKFKDTTNEALKDLQFAVEGWGRKFTDTIVDAFFGVKISATDMVNSILKDLARMAVQKNITEPIFKGVLGALGGGFGGLFSGAGAATNTSSTTFDSYSGKAAGGQVSSGTPYRVGEMGPEMFVPSVSGSIVPNGEMGGHSVTINQSIHVDSRSDMQSVYSMMKMASARAKSEIMSDLQRGGPFSRATR